MTLGVGYDPVRKSVMRFLKANARLPWQSPRNEAALSKLIGPKRFWTKHSAGQAGEYGCESGPYVSRPLSPRRTAIDSPRAHSDDLRRALRLRATRRRSCYGRDRRQELSSRRWSQDQSCRYRGGRNRIGNKDGAADLAAIVAGKDVTLRGEDDAPDRYGRQSGFVFLEDKQAGAEPATFRRARHRCHPRLPTRTAPPG